MDDPALALMLGAIDKRVSEEIGELLRSHKGMIYKVALYFHHRSPGSELEDMIQAASHGFVKAAHLYDDTKGASYLTYAAWWARCEVQKIAHDCVSRGMAKPAGRTGIVSVNVYNPQSRERSKGGVIEGADRDNWAETIPGRGEPEPPLIAAEDLWPLIRKFVTPREYRILEARFRYGKTLKEVGKEINRTRARVQQIQVSALDRLRQSPEFRRKTLEDFVSD